MQQAKTAPLWKRGLTILGVLIGLPVIAFAAAVLWPQPELLAEITTTPIAVTNVTVVDIKTGTLMAGQTVVTRGNRIVAVGPSKDIVVPAGARRVDGRGRFLMPALWDMHTHIYAISPLLDLSMYIAYGVTNVRDMQGCPSVGDPFIACYEDKRRWSEEAERGKRVGPRVVEASSFMANGPGMADRLNGVPRYFDTSTAQEARQFVRHFQGRADSIKVYDNIPREAYFALVDEAARQGLPVVGHRPRAISAIEAAKHQRSIEHARFLLHESFDGSDQLRAAAGTPAWQEDGRAMVDRHDAQRAQAIFKAMREAGTYYVPTHLTRWSDAHADQPEVRDDPNLIYLHPLMKLQWLEDINALSRAPSPQAREAYLDFYRKGLELTAQAQAAGVKIMVGTDYIAPGADVHRELEQLVLAGLTPQQALMAATVVPAEYAGRSELYGEIGVGKAADLVLLDRNPLADIGNTRQIRAVIFNGNLYDAAAIRRIKRHVEDASRSWRVGAKILWRFLKNPVNY